MVLSKTSMICLFVMMMMTTMTSYTDAFSTISSSSSLSTLQQTKRKRVSFLQKSNYFMSSNNNNNYSGEEDEKPADVVGAKFFGGSAVKDELFDLKEEESALELLKKGRVTTVATRDDEEGGAEDDEEEEEEDRVYNRFEDDLAFTDDFAKKVSMALQLQMNEILYDDNDNDVDDDDRVSVQYSKAAKWDTPLRNSKSSSSPLEELQNAKQFYNRIDVAILSASSSSNNEMSLRWEISLLWPSPWQPQVLLTGTSKLTLDASSSDTIIITSQTDKLDDGGKQGTDITSALSSQLLPRFWDLYHIGMTPAAERSPLLPPTKSSSSFLAPYKLYELPPRLYCETTLPSSLREYREADVIPNHAFVTAIKTMGPNKQTYVTTTPVQVSIIRRPSSSSSSSSPDKKTSKNVIQWNIPLPPQFTSNPTLPLPSSDNNDDETCTYQYQPSKRLIATLPYNGSIQDNEITVARKKLYDAVVKDGYKPVLDKDSGRPKFFVYYNDVKACFTRDGLGMAVYEWRPDFGRGNEVGIELEM
uniref:Uncharacterized protein n=1 Tax=Helicotheca tamesis TaxID=374047 RepID=A0A7S2I5R8_9STRA